MGMSSKCLYKEILNQTAENTSKFLNKERINYQNKETMVNRYASISKEYVAMNPRDENRQRGLEEL